MSHSNSTNHSSGMNHSNSIKHSTHTKTSRGLGHSSKRTMSLDRAEAEAKAHTRRANVAHLLNRTEEMALRKHAESDDSMKKLNLEDREPNGGVISPIMDLSRLTEGAMLLETREGAMPPIYPEQLRPFDTPNSVQDPSQRSQRHGVRFLYDTEDEDNSDQSVLSGDEQLEDEEIQDTDEEEDSPDHPLTNASALSGRRTTSGPIKGLPLPSELEAVKVSQPDPDNPNGPPLQAILYVCPYPECAKQFSRYFNLRSHFRIHSGERPYTCSDCGLAFARNHDLKRHTRIHSGFKPYLCKKCKKGFSRHDAMSRHIKLNSCLPKGSSASSSSHSSGKIKEERSRVPYKRQPDTVSLRSSHATLRHPFSHETYSWSGQTGPGTSNSAPSSPLFDPERRPYRMTSSMPHLPPSGLFVGPQYRQFPLSNPPSLSPHAVQADLHHNYAAGMRPQPHSNLSPMALGFNRDRPWVRSGDMSHHLPQGGGFGKRVPLKKNDPELYSSGYLHRGGVMPHDHEQEGRILGHQLDPASYNTTTTPSSLVSPPTDSMGHPLPMSFQTHTTTKATWPYPDAPPISPVGPVSSYHLSSPGHPFPSTPPLISTGNPVGSGSHKVRSVPILPPLPALSPSSYSTSSSSFMPIRVSLRYPTESSPTSTTPPSILASSIAPPPKHVSGPMTGSAPVSPILSHISSSPYRPTFQKNNPTYAP